MKKMRKLIPAFAMLMIAAIMMTTASFAWFTMNETVTANGMQVQAKASGNLLISTSKMNAAYIGMDATANDTYHDPDNGSDRSKVNLSPITHNGTNWLIPSTGNDVDPTYGTLENESGFTTVSPTTSAVVKTYFAEYVFYVATAGDALTNQYLYAKINAIGGADQTIVPAYTVAFYVVADGQDTPALTDAAFWNAPVATVNYKDGHTDKVVLGTTTNKFTIPSTYGKNNETAVGLRVIMRVYVDGDLDAEDSVVPTLVYKTAATYSSASMSGYKFYKITGTDSEGNSTYSAVEEDKTLWTDGKDLTGYAYTDGTTTNVNVPTKYVNNETIPSGSTKFEIELSASETYNG